MPNITLQAQEFMSLFSGNSHSYGEFIPSGKADKGKKQEGIYRLVSNKRITIEEYKSHLEGSKGLGIVPVTEIGMCKFAVIDVDIYNEELSMYLDAIERGNFPLVPFKSKSGGLHLYSFFKEETSAKKAVEVMKKISSLLSIDALVKNKKNGSVEIFPKQMKIKEGEHGSFINLPYFNFNESVQYAIRGGKPLSMNDALLYMKEKRISIGDAETFLSEIEFGDAPPCLQMIYILDPFERMSGRNNYLFSLGVYLKKKDEDYFEQRLHEANQCLKNPLEEGELEKTVLSSLRKKDYVYRCKETPCVDFCHKKECKKREYGIGKDEGYFSTVECGQLYQYKMVSPYYEWEVRLQGQETFIKLKFNSEDEIIRQDTFLRLCMRELHELPSKMKQQAWFNKVNDALKVMKEIAVDLEDDTSSYTFFTSLVYEFMSGQAMAETREQIKAKRVFYDREAKQYYFRGEDLQGFILMTKQFRYYSPQEFHGLYRQIGCVPKRIRLKEEQMRVWSLAKEDLDKLGKISPYTDMNMDFSKFAEDEKF